MEAVQTFEDRATPIPLKIVSWNFIW